MTGARLAAAGGLAVALAAGLCSCGEARPAPNVLLISIDSLRADHLGCYGYPRDTSPTLDRLAASGVRFENAQSPTSWTLPAHVTLLTGRAQHRHGILSERDRIPEGEQLLGEVFAEHGYETLGLFSGPLLDPIFGFDRGFEAYLSCRSPQARGRPALKTQGLSHADRTNGRIQRAFAAWLERRSARPFFAFIHMWDVHFDYVPPEPQVARFDPDYEGPLDGTNIVGRGFPLTAPPRDVEHLVARYDGEIRSVDGAIAKLLERLETAGLRESTLIVITADHGEEFLEHGGKTHRRTLYEESVRVPLILAGPGVPRDLSVADPVGLADVAPTILDLVGLEGLPNADGRSLLPLLEGTEQSRRPVFGALYRGGTVSVVTLRRGATKVVHEPGDARWAQYDLDADPDEAEPGPVDPALESTLRARLREVGAALGADAVDPDRVPEPLPEALAEELRALGYLE